MRRTLALSLLVLLFAGLAYYLYAEDQEIACYTCQSLDTWSHFECDICPGPEEWNSEAMSGDGLCPPYDEPCPGCTTMIAAQYCYCIDCTEEPPFWTRPE